MDMINENGSIKEYLELQEEKDLLRFITCGSVDDGKSTLIGRLLYDSKKILKDQMTSLKQDSKRVGTQNGKLDLALLVDGLQSEREQGITIDVAYRFFYTDKKKYVIADTPGHEQYTRNMATGASTADLAIILIDATRGVLAQTKRHSYIVTLIGIKHLIIAINKMDLVEYSQEKFESIKQKYQDMRSKLPNHEKLNIYFIPISALEGDNVVAPSSNMSWWKGKPLFEFLDDIKITEEQDKNFRFPVQYVNRPNLNFRGFCGTIVSGEIREGDSIKILPSNQISKVKNIISPHFINPNSSSIEEAQIKKAIAPMSITLTLSDEIDVSRGDMIVKKSDDVQMSDNFDVMLIWMSEFPMQLDKSYLIKCSTALVHGTFEKILYKKEINTLEKIKTNSLGLNDIAQCSLSLSKKIPGDVYNQHKKTGSFIVIDRITNETVAAGMITKINTMAKKHKREYIKEDIELNEYVRKKFPEWQCLSIDEIYKEV